MTKDRKRIQGYIPLEMYDWVQQKIKEGVFANESHAVFRALSILRSYSEGKLLYE